MILGHQSGILSEAQAQNGADEYSNGALPSIGGAQVRINGAFGLEYSVTLNRMLKNLQMNAPFAGFWTKM